MAYPKEFRYSRTHEWVKMDGDVATIGITQFAQEQLGDVVFVEAPAVGKKLGAGDSSGNIESVKAVSEIFAPIAGEVVEVNAELQAHPELINQDPHGRGWLMRLKVAGAGEELLDAAAYEAFLAEEGAH
ncbi:MAG: glycine cleavage system protein GcvH [Acidobacteriota bacterium]